MQISLEDRHALVCGASKGIGRAAALALASTGAEVSVLARSGDALNALVPRLISSGASDARAIIADLDRPEGLRRAIRDLVDEHPVHIWINNTGGPKGGRLMDATPQDLRHAFQRHVLASQLMLNELLPGMIEAGYGRIVNVLSTSVREPIPNLGVSNTIRGAMASWAKTLSHELPPGLTINNVLPGFTDTERLAELRQANAERTTRTEGEVLADWVAQIPEGRLARPMELGMTIAWLASPAAAYIRGQSIAVDGGRLRSI